MCYVFYLLNLGIFLLRKLHVTRCIIGYVGYVRRLRYRNVIYDYGVRYSDIFPQQMGITICMLITLYSGFLF